MKALKKIMVIASLIAVIMSFSGLQTYAASVEQNNVKFSFTTEKETYVENETVSAVLEISNVGSEDVTDVKWISAVPEGYEFVDSSFATQTVDVIHPNESAKLKSEFKPTTGGVDGSTEEATSSTDATSNAEENVTKPTESNNATADQNNDAIQTGTVNAIVAIVLAVVLISLGVFVTLKNKKNAGRFLSIFLCMAIVSGIVPIAYAAEGEEEKQPVAETTRYQVQLEEDVKVGDKTVTLTSTVNYSLPAKEEVFDENYYEDSKTFTKGEWITILANKLGIEVAEFPEGYDYFYGDSVESEYGPIVETALGYGLLPAPDSPGYIDPEQDVPLFEADKTATREFVAYTVAKAMGYEGEYALNAADAASVKYTNEVAVIVKQQYMALIDNEFKPASAATGADANKILNRIDYFNDSLEVDEGEEKDIIEYQDGVISLDEEYKATKSEDGIYTVELTKVVNDSNLVEGTVIVLPPSEDYLGGLPLKIKEVKEVDGKTVFVCEEPAIEEVIESFDYAGYGAAVTDGIVAADGVEVEYDPNGVVEDENSDVDAFDVGGSIPGGSVTYTLRKKEIKPGLEASGKVEVAIPDITAKAKGKVWGGFELEELTFTVTDELKFTGELSYDFGIPESSYHVTTGKPKFGSGKTELGRVPFALGATGFTVDLVFFVNLDVSGKLSISYALDRKHGIQYKDETFRNIKEYSSEFTALELNGSAKLGVGMAVRLTYISIFELLGVDFHGGVGVSVGFTAHLDTSPVLFCGDATIYLYLTFELDKDTIVGFLLDEVCHLELTWDIFTEKNSPVKASAHIENMKWVDDCTYGKGSLLGVVKDKSTGERIGGAQVKIYRKHNGRLVKSGYTRTTDTFLADNTVLKGEFFVDNLSAGTYQFEVKATGYKKAVVEVDVVGGQRVVCEATLMVDRDNLEGTGTVSGAITNALTGSTVSGVKYDVRSGLNTRDGEVIATGTANGSYSLELAPGYYSILFTKGGFVDELISVTINADGNTTKNVAMAPTSDITIDDESFRVVLTWGATPSDLDSHMYYVADDGSGFHTCYYDKNHYENGDTVANLDLDDTTSYGPETSTVYQAKDNGVYSFYVHDYSNRHSDSSTAMSNSGAQVKLFSGSVLLATFNIPENRGGTLWHVFDYDASTGSVDYVNEFSYATAG